MIRNIWNKC